MPLSVRSDLSEIIYSLKLPDSGLEVKTRNWLKITIPDAFIGKSRMFCFVVEALRSKFLQTQSID